MRHHPDKCLPATRHGPSQTADFVLGQRALDRPIQVAAQSPEAARHVRLSSAHERPQCIGYDVAGLGPIQRRARCRRSPACRSILRISPKDGPIAALTRPVPPACGTPTPGNAAEVLNRFGGRPLRPERRSGSSGRGACRRPVQSGHLPIENGGAGGAAVRWCSTRNGLIDAQRRSKRSRFITLVHAPTKSRMNSSCPSAEA